MDSYVYLLYIFILSHSIVTFCHCQIFVFITEPRVTSIVPLNSTALTVNWEFASQAYDQSDLIRIYIVFYEFYYTYNRVYASTNYTFTTANKTITSLTKNFELVNAYYYVCFSSNSTVTNVSQYLSIINSCTLTRTCSRSGNSCPGPSVVTVLATNITSNSFTILFLWPNDLPYTWNSSAVKLTNNSQTVSAYLSSQNNTYTTRSYQFTGLKSQTSYTVNASFSYAILGGTPTTNITILTVKTSCSSKLLCADDLLFLLSCSMILFFTNALK